VQSLDANEKISKFIDRGKPGFLLSPILGNPMDQCVLQLRIELLPAEKKDESYLFFMGGFDPAVIINNPRLPSTFVSLLYPAMNFEDLYNKLGSMDIDALGNRPALT